MRRLVVAFLLAMATVFFGPGSMAPAHAEDLTELMQGMITAYSQSSKGVEDEAFKVKVNEIDSLLREKIEKDHDIVPFKDLVEESRKFKARAGARKMFTVVLERALKRLKFTQAQQDITDPDLLKEIDDMMVKIEWYLDPNLPDEDTVDRKRLEARRKSIRDKIMKEREANRNLPEEKRISVEVTDASGQAGRLPGSREGNLLAKLKTIVPDPGKMTVTVTLKRDDLLDIRVDVKGFTAPSGFSVIEGDMHFVDVSGKALDNSDSSTMEGVFDDTHFKRYRVVQNTDQLNVMPHAGNAAYEMGSLMPGQSYKMDFKQKSGISGILKDLEGNTEIVVLNGKTAQNDMAIEFKNMGTRNLIYLQGTDITGLVSVKALGFLKPKDGQATFKEVLLIVDDQLSSDLTRFVGEQGINFFLKRASENLRKGLPFTPVLEHIACERDEEGKMFFIFTGRGRHNS